MDILRSAEQPSERRHALELLADIYWEPVYCSIRLRGYSEEDSKDLTQEFMLQWIIHHGFEKASPEKGRFRALLLRSLKNFLINAHRTAQAKQRRPEGGFIALDAGSSTQHPRYVPRDDDTPESIFNRTWARSFLLRALDRFEAECAERGNSLHYELFQERIVEPIFNGADAMPLRSLAAAHGITERQAANVLITARRMFQRLLREAIREYASTDEEVGEEMQELARCLTTGQLAAHGGRALGRQESASSQQ